MCMYDLLLRPLLLFLLADITVMNFTSFLTQRNKGKYVSGNFGCRAMLRTGKSQVGKAMSKVLHTCVNRTHCSLLLGPL